MYVILKKWGYTLYKPKFSEIFKTIKSSTDVFINNLMPNLYNSFSVLLLGAFWGANSNGLYDGGNKVPTIFYNFQAALSRAFFPFLSRHPERHGLYEKINIVSAVSGAVILVVLSPWIISILLGPDFSDSVPVMRILSISVIFLAMSFTYGTNYLIINHKEKALRNLTFASSIIGMFISIPLVYCFSYIGAAVTVLICRGLLGVGSWLLTLRYKKIQA